MAILNLPHRRIFCCISAAGLVFGGLILWQYPVSPVWYQPVHNTLTAAPRYYIRSTLQMGCDFPASAKEEIPVEHLSAIKGVKMGELPGVLQSLAASTGLRQYMMFSRTSKGIQHDVYGWGVGLTAPSGRLRLVHAGWETAYPQPSPLAHWFPGLSRGSWRESLWLLPPACMGLKPDSNGGIDTSDCVAHAPFCLGTLPDITLPHPIADPYAQRRLRDLHFTPDERFLVFTYQGQTLYLPLPTWSTN